jgi:hypothetical protein
MPPLADVLASSRIGLALLLATPHSIGYLCIARTARRLRTRLVLTHVHIVAQNVVDIFELAAIELVPHL